MVYPDVLVHPDTPKGQDVKWTAPQKPSWGGGEVCTASCQWALPVRACCSWSLRDREEIPPQSSALNTEIPLWCKACHPQAHPEATCTLGAKTPAPAPRAGAAGAGGVQLFVSAACWEQWCVRQQIQAPAGFPAAGAASSQG